MPWFDPGKHAKMQAQVNELLRKLKAPAETIPAWKIEWQKASDLNDANYDEMSKGKKSDASFLLSHSLFVLNALDRIMFRK